MTQISHQAAAALMPHGNLPVPQAMVAAPGLIHAGCDHHLVASHRRLRRLRGKLGGWLWLVGVWSACPGCLRHRPNPYGTWNLHRLQLDHDQDHLPARGPVVVGHQWGTRAAPASATQAAPDAWHLLAPTVEAGWHQWCTLQDQLGPAWRASSAMFD